ncbi:unnamed protein product [Sphagnum tenellum]
MAATEYPTPFSASAAAFPTPAEAAVRGLNPNPPPLETGLSDQGELPALVNAHTAATQYHSQMQNHHQQGISNAIRHPEETLHNVANGAADAPLRSFAAGSERTINSVRGFAAVQSGSIRSAYQDGVAQGENYVGLALETVYNVVHSVADKVTDKVNAGRKEGGER